MRFSVIEMYPIVKYSIVLLLHEWSTKMRCKIRNPWLRNMKIHCGFNASTYLCIQNLLLLAFFFFNSSFAQLFFLSLYYWIHLLLGWLSNLTHSIYLVAKYEFTFVTSFNQFFDFMWSSHIHESRSIFRFVFETFVVLFFKKKGRKMLLPSEIKRWNTRNIPKKRKNFVGKANAKKRKRIKKYSTIINQFSISRLFDVERCSTENALKI